MTSRDSGDGSSSATADASTSRLCGPYVLLPLLDSVPLVADGSSATATINCVEYLDGNLYVGTSASELLHFVQIAPDATDKSGKPIFILASRLAPSFSVQSVTANTQPGVQEIVLLPKVGKACILCNWTVSFFSLPELSPVSGTGHAKNCSWIGGINTHDKEPDDADDDTNPEVTILLSLKRRIQVVRVGQGARAVKNIDYAGSILSVRCDTIACVADSRSYALLDINRQLKIPLMKISSLDESPSPEDIGHANSPCTDTPGAVVRSASSAHAKPHTAAQQAHGRSTSLGNAVLGYTRHHKAHPVDDEGRVSSPAQSTRACPPPPNSTSSPLMSAQDKLLPALPPQASVFPAQTAHDGAMKERAHVLKPHIASLAVDEFLVVIGTSPSEPGLGMSVNLDGEVSRAPIEFERYPRQIVVDDCPVQRASSQSDTPDDQVGYIVASITRTLSDGKQCHGLEIQRWDAGSQEDGGKYWLKVPGAESEAPYGICRLTGHENVHLDDVVAKLCQRRFSALEGAVGASRPSLQSCHCPKAPTMEKPSKQGELFERDNGQDDDDGLPDGWEEARNAEEEAFARRLAKSQACLAVWAGDRLWWAARNPRLLQLDTALDGAYARESIDAKSVDKKAIFAVLGSLGDGEARSELDYMALSYLRQKAGLLLLIAALTWPETDEMSDGEMGLVEQVLVDSKLDPRAVLCLVPGVSIEVVEGRRGIWIYGGVKQVAQEFLRSAWHSKAERGRVGAKTQQLLGRFLWSWRRMKGFGSVADERQVFQSVDAALLVLLLDMDGTGQQSRRDLGKGGGASNELYELVDQGVECFQRAVDVLESHHRLFVLSRLYQSRKRAGDVLATWRRIVEGERDDGQELRDGEQRIREYLTRVSSQPLVEEYGIWLANRNPRLGVEVFADERARAPVLEPGRVVAMLRAQAPRAVKYYLEHLVFGKGHTSHVNELIAFYLDVVIAHVEDSQSSRQAVLAAYDAYRALPFPKLTYYHFLEANAPKDDDVWHSRLRLLQLLAGPHDYDCQAIRRRISSLAGDVLVPETIVLAAREHHGSHALRLLVHRLGDYDTAVAYCLRGGNSVYCAHAHAHAPFLKRRPDSPSSAPPREQQRRLFHALLNEFLAIGDAADCMQQTGALLERFGPWFDVCDVLRLLPNSWPVAVVAGFLLGAMKRLLRDKNETRVTRALRGAENLAVNYNVVVRIHEAGPSIEAPD